MDRIIRTCSAAGLAAAVLALAAPAGASTPSLGEYLHARLADGQATAQTAAAYGHALDAEPDNPVIAIRAYRVALELGDTALERRARAPLVKADAAPDDEALLALADALAAGNDAGAEAALTRVSHGPLDFLMPMLRAWMAYPRAPAQALALLAKVPQRTIGTRYGRESQALMLIASGEAQKGLIMLVALDDASPVARIAAAALLRGAGQRDFGRLLPPGAAPPPAAQADARWGVARLFLSLALDLTGDETGALAVTLARAAERLAPTDSDARIVTARVLAESGAMAAALATIDAIPPGDAAYPEARGLRLVLLRRAGEVDQARAAAAQLSGAPGAGADDAQRYGEVLMAADRPADAARAFSMAISRAGANADWLLYLQAGSAREQAGDWKGAEPLLRKAVALGPDQPAALNYLGYAALDHGGDIAAATRMLERAAQLRPGDAAILDSLGWAYLRGGDTARAVPLLERAAEGAPADATISEHLGDAYWRLGRRYEARYAWIAAGHEAAPGEAARLQGKVERGIAAH